MPMAGGLGKAVRNGKAIGCTAIQIFTSSPQNWRAKPITDAMVEDFVAAQKETGITEVVSHDSYLINLCAPDPDRREQAIGGLKAEIERCAQYGIKFTVSHMGAHLGQGEEAGLSAVAESARRVLDETPESVTLLMETTAGQGSCLNYRFEHLASLIEKLDGHPRACVCLDTCHIFAAGYDIRTDETYDATFAAFQKIIGFDRLRAIHINDSKKAFGSRVDRHDHIGEGLIGETPFRRMMNDDRFRRIPILLETPIENEGHEKDLAKLKSFFTVA